MKNFQEKTFEVKKLKRDIADLQIEVDYLEMRKGRMNNVLNNESRIIKNLGSLKRVIRQDTRLHNGLRINHLHSFGNDDDITFKNGKIFIGDYENNDHYRNDDVNVAVIIDFERGDSDVYDTIIEFA